MENVEINLYDLEENDDEAEKRARRELNASRTNRHENSLNFSTLSNLSTNEIRDRITQCLKLNAENKINEKNAFQLQMIDFLIFSLKKQDVEMSNLQMASACLDASGKIYAYRVDKVHSDLLKVVGHAGRGEKRGHEDDLNNNNEDNANRQRKKRRRNQCNIISTIEALKGNLDTYNPLSMMNTQRDVQTSDMLFQANLPQHADQGIALNLYNDVLLDRIPLDAQKSKVSTCLVDDFSADVLSPSYAAFQFLGWSADDELEESQASKPVDNVVEDGEYHFNLDDPISDDDNLENSRMMDCRDPIEESYERLAQNARERENIVDFQDIIANNPNLDAKYEYSYMQLNHRIDWAGPSHWKVKVYKNNNGVVEICKQGARRKKHDICLSYSRASKETSKNKFIRRKRLALCAENWSEDKTESPLDTISHDAIRFYDYCLKPIENGKFFNNDSLEENDQCYNNVRNTEENLDFNNSLDISNFEVDIPSDAENDAAIAHSQEAFIGDNLVLAPSLVTKVFVPYSQRAKRIDMHKLNKATQQLVQVIDENETIEFSSIYSQLPGILSKTNADSLSPALALVSLLHIAHKENLVLSSRPDLCDLTISNHRQYRH